MANIQRTRAEAILDRVRGASDPLRIKLQDKVLPIKRMQEQIERELGIPISEPLNLYMAEANYHGIVGERSADLRDRFVEPLIERMNALNVDSVTLNKYLIARHAPERNAEILKRDPKNSMGSGITDSQAAQDMQDIAPQRQALEELARIIDKHLKRVRKQMVADGLISNETLMAWEAMFKFYVPLRGFETDEETDMMARIGRGFDVRGKESKAALGRLSKSDSPLAYILMQSEQAIVRGEKNRVARTLLRMVQTFTDPEIWTIAKAKMERRLNPKTGLVEFYAVPPAFSRAENLFAVKIGGKVTWVEVHHKGLARALRGATQGSTEGIIRAMYRLARGYSMLVTSYSPEFVPTNWMRDIELALVNISDVNNKPAGVRRQIIKDAVSAKTIRGILTAIRDPSSSKEYAKWFEEYRHAGGKISFLGLNEISEIKRDIDSRLKAVGRSKLNPWELAKKTARAIDILNTAVENSTRLSAYIALRKGGVSKSRAAFIARELTVNFNRKGEWSTGLNTAYLFFNAAAQGTMRLAQGVAKSKLTRRAIYMMAALGAAQDIINSFLSPEDDDGEKIYDQIQPWVKERNIIIANPWNEGDFIYIPLGYGINVPYLAGQNFVAMMRGVKKPLDAAIEMGIAALSSFNPLGTAPNISQLITPTLADPIVQWEQNTTWYGGHIRPTIYDKNKPMSETYFRSAPEWAKSMTKWLNEMTGGNVGKSGWLDISPEMVEHYVEFAGGGIGKFIANSVQTAEKLINGEEIPPEEIPMARRFYGSQDTAKAKRGLFYESYDEVDAAHFEVNQLKKVGEQKAAQEAIARNRPLLQAYKRLTAIRKELRNLDDRREQIRGQSDLSQDEKRRQLDAVDTREQGILRSATQIYGDAKRQME